MFIEKGDSNESAHAGRSIWRTAGGVRRTRNRRKKRTNVPGDEGFRKWGEESRDVISERVRMALRYRTGHFEISKREWANVIALLEFDICIRGELFMNLRITPRGNGSPVFDGLGGATRGDFLYG